MKRIERDVIERKHLNLPVQDSSSRLRYIMQQHAGVSCKILWNSKEIDKTIIIEKATAFKSASETKLCRKKLKHREIKEE